MNNYSSIPGWWSEIDARLYRRAVSEAPDLAHFVEVGSWQGRSAACMAELLRDSDKLIRFDCVDTWEGSPYGSHPGHIANLEAEGKTLRGEFEANLRKFGLWPYVNPIQGDSPKVAATYEDASLDFVCIDGDHRYDWVRADIESWLPKLKPGALLGGHDWGNEDVMAAVRDTVGEPEHKGMVWWIRLPGSDDAPRYQVTYPMRFPGVQNGWTQLQAGFADVGCEVTFSRTLEADGYWCPPGRYGEPIHIAPLDVGGTRVWYDCSDFTLAHPDIAGPGDLYYKKQCLAADVPDVRPIGQYIAKWAEYRELRDELLDLSVEPPEHEAVAVFSNIDERSPNSATPADLRANVTHQGHGLRRKLVSALKDRPGVVSGLWRWSPHRPAISPDLWSKRISQDDHWRRLARSRMAFALPGVGGDTTRTHVEIMAMGVPLVTVETVQEWPGNWRGCWVEMKRDLSDLDDAINRLRDGQERERMGRLGLWYWERNVSPTGMAERVLHDVCEYR